MIVQEYYHAVIVPPNATTIISPTGIATAFFLCTVAGTISIARGDGVQKVNALPVSAGVYYPLPMLVGPNATITTAGGATGTLGYTS